MGLNENAEELIIEDAIEKNASDIHFEPNEKEVLVRIRVDGKLSCTSKLLKYEFQAILSKIKIQSNLDIAEKRKSQDGKMIFIKDKSKYDLRISIIPIVYGEKLVVRILYSDILKYSLEKVDFTKEQRRKLNKIINLRSGMVIVNGPTGSGKSTTLYSILSHLNSEDVNINTIEDPIEVIIKGINQVNLNRKINMDFPEGVRSLLRQDPDIMMIGEIRDEETAKISVRACFTGHKVYTTIHTKDPREIYFRLEEMGVKKYWIRDALVGVISQRLMRVLCEKCKCESENIIYKGEEIRTYKSVGCDECNYSGYKGRGVVAAVHYIDRELKSTLDNIYCDKSILSNDEMVENLNNLLIKGKITLKDFKNFIEMEELQYDYEKELG